MSETYDSFAHFYDALNAEYSPQKRFEFLRPQLLEKRGGDILDAGCGTGDMCALLAENGFSVVGADISTEMLNTAREKCATYGERVLLINQDITKLNLFGTVTAVLCMQDTLNHLSGIRAVSRAFSRFSLFAEPGAYLFFDVNTLYKHRNVLADSCFVIEAGKLFCTWRCELFAGDNILHRLDVFESIGETYTRTEFEIKEYFHDPALIERTLADNGWRVTAKTDGDTYAALTETSQRILYTAVKE